MPDRFERPDLWGVIDLDDERWLYVFALAMLVVGALLMHNLRRARAGRVIIATRDNERMAAAAGINPVEARLGAFVLSGVVAGVAGALHAVTQRSVGEGSYPASTSLLLFSMAVIGGVVSLGFVGAVDTALSDPARTGDPWDVVVTVGGIPTSEVEAKLDARGRA